MTTAITLKNALVKNDWPLNVLLDKLHNTNLHGVVFEEEKDLKTILVIFGDKEHSIEVSFDKDRKMIKNSGVPPLEIAVVNKNFMTYYNDFNQDLITKKINLE